MKTWLTKLKISSALDDRRPLPPAVERIVAQSDELRRFAKTTADLHRIFQNSRPEVEAPASLHAAIMRAVRSAKPEPTFGWRNLWPRLIPAAAIALLVLLGVIGVGYFFRSTTMVSQPAESSAFATASSALETSGTLVRALPGATLSPLNEEMRRLTRDLDGTKKFLLASLP